VSAEEDQQARWKSALCDQVHSHGRLLFRMAFGFLREASAAEDVCQQAFLKAWEERERIRSLQALRPWLMRTVTNASLEIVRRRRIEQRVMRGEAQSRGEGATVPVFEADTRDALLEALEKLPETTRMVIVLRVMRGLSGNEVKDMIGCSASEVSRHLHRGLGHLRGLLPEFETEFNG
jgi:RNA polymerase sigma factor (sigma-70 family)